MRKLKPILFTIGTIFVLIITSQAIFSGIAFENEISNEIAIDQNPIKSTYYSQTNTMIISDDGDFITYGFPGAGTKENPYRIENLDFANNTDYMLMIIHTSLHFVVQNCTFYGINGASYAITIQNADNWIFRNNTIQGCDAALYVVSSEYFQIYDNKMYNTSNNNGILMNTSFNGKIRDNTIYDTSRGISIYTSENLTISDNKCYNNLHGIYLAESKNVTITRNNCSSNTDTGIRLFGLNYNTTVRDNLCYNNSVNGILLQNNWDIRAYNNTLIENRYGISAINSFDLTLEKNIFTDQTDYGFNINNLNDSIIKNNDVRNNNRGINAIYTNSLTIWNNTIYGATWGIRSEDSRLTNICYNDIRNTTMYGMYLQGTNYYDYANVSYNYMENCDPLGICFYLVNFGFIKGNELTDNNQHIVFYNVNYTYIGSNIITLGDEAIKFESIVYSCVNNTIELNNITGMQTGIQLINKCYNTTILRNRMENNGSMCIWINESQNTNIKHNIFFGDDNGVILRETANYTNVEWNTFIGFTSNHAVDHGWYNVFQYNYWDDWLIPDLTSDGIVDNPRPISGSAGNEDPFPIAVSSIYDYDNDGLTNFEEYILGTDAENNDTDSDLLLDGAEVYEYFTDPLNNDTDFDLLLDGSEIITYLTNPLNNDTDFDNLSDGDEVIIHGTSPTNPDSDSDLMPDGWEVSNSLNPLINDATSDADFDDLNNYNEYLEGTNPQNNDTEGDGMTDGWEVTNSLDPLVNDAAEDPDIDGLTNLEEYGYLTDPHDEDTDDDNWSDGDEIAAGTDPLDPNSYPIPQINYPEVILEDPVLITIIVASSLAIATAAGAIAFRTLLQNLATKVSSILEKATLNDKIMGSIQGELGDAVEDVAEEFKRIDVCPKCHTKGYGPYCHVCGFTIDSNLADILKRSAYKR